ncbi:MULTISPECIES: class I SAM-dependent methyltransferase [unclassified Francisella]|uniref:class I SAM-dependent methyltransferase n=1 Tax=unclassified Francisella TaxID=2610885 RepID=UPI002E3038C8|nr:MULTISPECIES: class I SAM-dependent methyltransferase [unclassified Francisella]MED7818896.1 class I SAM-dependent methyltransferase [Francisella sp. 19S2-4]MED7829733.1 class I SAM-dependent methyltransferase [Francisella sp. 19S2-10]
MLKINSPNQYALYNNLTIDQLKRLASDIDLDISPDIKCIETEIFKSAKILDIGSGYGRSIRYLLDLDKNLSITGVELNTRYYDELVKQFSQDSVKLVKGSILDIDITDKFDSILMLWCFIYEFSDIEIYVLLSKLKSLVDSKSRVYIDVLADHKYPANAVHIKDSIYETNYGGYANINNNEKIIDMFIKSGFVYDKTFEYSTVTNNKKILVFKKVH